MVSSCIINYTTACLSYPSILIWYHRLYHSLLVISKHRYMVSSTIPQPACHIETSLCGIIHYTTACLKYPSVIIMVSSTIPQPACHIEASFWDICYYTTTCFLYPSIGIWYIDICFPFLACQLVYLTTDPAYEHRAFHFFCVTYV